MKTKATKSVINDDFETKKNEQIWRCISIESLWKNKLILFFWMKKESFEMVQNAILGMVDHNVDAFLL